MAVEEMQFLCNLPLGERYLVGFTKSLGKGKLTYLGLQPSAQLLKELFRILRIPNFSQATSPEVVTGLFEGDQDYFLFVVNHGQEAKSIVVKLDNKTFSENSYQAFDLVMGDSKVVYFPESTSLVLHLSGKDATVIKLTQV